MTTNRIKLWETLQLSFIKKIQWVEQLKYFLTGGYDLHFLTHKTQIPRVISFNIKPVMF